MDREIVWKDSYKEALKLAKKEKKPLLIDFFNPN